MASKTLYGDLSLEQLKNELKSRNAKVSGRKRELVARLEAYDRNFNFGQKVDPVAHVHVMDIPERSTFRDINTNTQVPKITEAAVRDYLSLFQQNLREKPKEMYEGKFLKAIRISHSKDYVFIYGIVSAEMRKHTSYFVDIKIDEHGVIAESQCECAVGMGPDAHCKHVALVLYALTKAKDGITTMKTCTQTLQTFHQAKNYDGSPVKMENLKLRQSRPLLDLPTFDPRPQHFRRTPHYNDFFRNVWLNSRAEDLPVRQLFPPANIRAVCHDHDYLPQPPEDTFLDAMDISSITDDKKLSVEEMTRGQGDNKLWARERTKRLHASRYGEICKATDRKDKGKLAASLTLTKSLNCIPVIHGRKYESRAITEYSDKYLRSVDQSGIVIHKDLAFLACSPDGLVGDNGIVEVKCPYTARELKIGPMTVSYLVVDSDNNLQLRDNHEYYYQIMGTMACTDRKWCDFIVWTFKDMVVIRVPRNEKFIEEMRGKLCRFYNDYFSKAVLDRFLYKNTDKFMFY